MTAVLFVCLGNICRSPLAEGVFRAKVEALGLSQAIEIDSAGTGHWHAGSPPDPRSVAVAAANGIDISAQRARQVEPADFSRFNLILAMDRPVLARLQTIAPPSARLRIHLFLDLACGLQSDVPDPYYGEEAGFDDVYRMVRDASASLLARLVAS